MHQQNIPPAQHMHAAHSSPDIQHQAYPVPNPMPARNAPLNYETMSSNGIPNSVYDVFTIPHSRF